MNRKRNGLYAAEISLTTSAVQRGVAIQQLFPESRLGNANPVVLPDYRREIANKEQLVSRVSAAPKKADDASLKIGAVDPGETGTIEVQLV